MTNTFLYIHFYTSLCDPTTKTILFFKNVTLYGTVTSFIDRLSWNQICSKLKLIYFYDTKIEGN